MSPTPELPTPEQANFFITFWKEVIGGTIIILLGWYARLQGKSEPIYLDEEDVDQRMLICKQSIIIIMNEELDKRDEKLIQRIKELLN